MPDTQVEIRPNAVYTLAEVCEILNISDATMRRWIKSSQIRTSKVGHGPTASWAAKS
jgi:excisionase family DNA binding protein